METVRQPWCTVDVEVPADGICTVCLKCIKRINCISLGLTHLLAVQEGQRKFMGTLWNTYAFFVLYANIDNFDATKYTLDYDKLPIMDKWLLSKLNTLVKTVDEDLNDYKIPETARALQGFVDEMSNWYVRR